MTIFGEVNNAIVMVLIVHFVDVNVAVAVRAAGNIITIIIVVAITVIAIHVIDRCQQITITVAVRR